MFVTFYVTGSRLCVHLLK